MMTKSSKLCALTLFYQNQYQFFFCNLSSSSSSVGLERASLRSPCASVSLGLPSICCWFTTFPSLHHFWLVLTTVGQQHPTRAAVLEIALTQFSITSQSGPCRSCSNASDINFEMFTWCLICQTCEGATITRIIMLFTSTSQHLCSDTHNTTCSLMAARHILFM